MVKGKGVGLSRSQSEEADTTPSLSLYDYSSHVQKPFVGLDLICKIAFWPTVMSMLAVVS